MSTRREIAAAVAAEAAYMEDVLCRLIEAPTTLGNEEPGQEVMRDGVAGDRARARRPAARRGDAARASGGLAVLVGRLRQSGTSSPTGVPAGEGGRSLVLNGHIDVVVGGGREPVADGAVRGRARRRLALRPRRRRHEGRAGGDPRRGQGPRALSASRPLAPVQLQSVVEEECTGNGALQCAVSGLRADACVVTEPFPGSVSISQVGVLWFHVDIAGLPAHAGDAQDGANAIEASFPVVAALRRLEAELNESPPPPYDAFDHPINLNVGVLRGGDWPSTVAAECTLSCRLALYPGQQVEWLQAKVEEAVAGAAARASVPRRPPAARAVRRVRLRRRRDRAPTTRS